VFVVAGLTDKLMLNKEFPFEKPDQIDRNIKSKLIKK